MCVDGVLRTDEEFFFFFFLAVFGLITGWEGEETVAWMICNNRLWERIMRGQLCASLGRDSDLGAPERTRGGLPMHFWGKMNSWVARRWDEGMGCSGA